MLRAISQVIHWHFSVFVSFLLLWKEVVIHFYAGSVIWVFVMIDLYEFLIAANQHILIDLVIFYKLVDERRTALVNIVYGTSRYELFIAG